ncbi:MAG: DUF202 domain-containing protein [Cyanobacteria bacterium P01_H01_bin.15]
MSSSEPKPPNLQVELAKERTKISQDRTILSWIRLGLTLIGIGFGLDQVINTLAARFSDNANTTQFNLVVALSFVALGVYAILVAAYDYYRELQRLAKPDYTYKARQPLGETVAVALILISVAGIGKILWRILSAT